MNKMYYVVIFITVLLISFLGITYSYEYNDDSSLEFELVGPTTLYLDVYSEYEEYGIKVLYNNKNISDQVQIDDSKLNMNELGEYRIKYEVNINNRHEYVYRKVVVMDRKAPVIELTGGKDIYILLNGNYYEHGYTVNDNYDKNLDKKVTTSGSVNTSKEGEYVITYSVTDSSGNKGEVKRTVSVKKPVISIGTGRQNGIRAGFYNVRSFANTVIINKFNNNGIYYSGYVSNDSNDYKIKLKNRNNSLEYLYTMKKDKNHYYSGNLDLTLLANGVYDVYIIGNKEERLLNKLDDFGRIVRAKVGNKLITMFYDDDKVSISVEKFDYKYDVVIDPGHGGSDIGASNGIMLEKNMNLIVSKYEKCRYESMGYRVYMVRYDDTYGEMLGNSAMDQLDRRALTLGYYGSVSKIVYSNHHNGAANTSASGFEILVSNQATAKELAPELNLYKEFRKYYKITDNYKRMYSKNYDTDETYEKSNGEVYDITNYYSVIRMPYELFNVKNVIYEPIYLTNSSDYNWYWPTGNWRTISEMKIKEYVKYMGGTYNSDNKKCL